VSTLYSTKVTATGGRNDTGGFGLVLGMAVTIAGINQATAEDLVRRADMVCPYSNAIRGNVAVPKTVSVR
jgi:organic hydroperoxide reductase OsmC/OhrA